MKLSEKQKMVIQLMRDGWQLGFDRLSNRSWLQKNGLGRGGETAEVKRSTLQSLRKHELIVNGGHKYPVTQLMLTEKGKSIQL